MPGAKEWNMAVEQTHGAGHFPCNFNLKKNISEASLLFLGQIYSTLTMTMHIIKFLTSDLPKSSLPCK